MDTSNRLTRYPSGSFAEFFWLTIPLVVSFISRGGMFLVDRLVLANYSMESVIALTAAGTAFAAISMGVHSIVSISQVFAAQYNGAGKLSRVASPVWQMIWLSFGLNIVAIPLAEILPEYILAPLVREQGAVYFSWAMYFLLPTCFVYALNSFFTAIGKTEIVTFGAILANVINAVLCVVLALGYGGYVEPMGIKGAILSTIIAETFEATVLFVIFLSRGYRQKYGTLNWTYDAKLFWECIRIGLPSSVTAMVELGAWVVVSYIIATISLVHVATFSVFHAMFVFVAHLIHGVERSVSTVVANALGSRKIAHVHNALRHGIIFMLACIVLVFSPIILFPDAIISQFLCKSMSPAEYHQIMTAVQSAMVLVALYAAVDGIAWIYAGVLTAAADTRFIMLANSINAWVFGVLPIFFIAIYASIDPAYTWVSQSGFVVANILVFVWRFNKGHWKKVNLADDEPVCPS